MVADYVRVAVFIPLFVCGAPDCSCAASSCCSNGIPDAFTAGHPHWLVSHSLYRDQVISKDILCNVSDDRGICNVIANDRAFQQQYRSNTIRHVTLGSGLSVAYKQWYGPVTVLQEGSCQELPDSGCGIFEDRLSTWWNKIDVGVCSINKLSLPITAGSQHLRLDVAQRCSSFVSDLDLQNVQDLLEISMEWNNTYTGDLCDTKEARFKVDRSQWKEGPQGAQYVCLDVPNQTQVATNVNGLRLVVLNVGNPPCEGVINPPIDTAMKIQLSSPIASVLLLLCILGWSL